GSVFPCSQAHASLVERLRNIVVIPKEKENLLGKLSSSAALWRERKAQRAWRKAQNQRLWPFYYCLLPCAFCLDSFYHPICSQQHIGRNRQTDLLGGLD